MNEETHIPRLWSLPTLSQRDGGGAQLVPVVVVVVFCSVTGLHGELCRSRSRCRTAITSWWWCCCCYCSASLALPCAGSNVWPGSWTQQRALLLPHFPRLGSSQDWTESLFLRLPAKLCPVVCVRRNSYGYRLLSKTWSMVGSLHPCGIGDVKERERAKKQV